MIYPTLQDAKRRQNELLREVERQRLINLARRSHQHSQTGQSIYHKIKEFLSRLNTPLSRVGANHHKKERVYEK
jgi:hypothetical protein